MSSAAPNLTISLRLNGRSYGLSLDRRAALTLCAGLLLAVGWAVASLLYVALEGTTLGSIAARQVEMQYGYEDRIAELQAALNIDGREAAAARSALRTTLADLARRSEHLEERAAELERLALPDEAHEHPPAPGDFPTFNRSSLRLGEPVETDARTASAAAIGARLARAEATQSRAMEALRTPLERKATRASAALATLGLSASRDVGGPFVPLPPAAAGAGDIAFVLLKEAIQRAKTLDAILVRLPVRSPLTDHLEVTSSFGPRMDPFLGRPALHTGVDLHEDFGSAVHATAAGTVTIAGSDRGYGTMVEIDHGDGLATRYAHLSSSAVVVGERVTPRTIVGFVGASGRATGPHLHYEVRLRGAPVDPARYLAAGARLAGN